MFIWPETKIWGSLHLVYINSYPEISITVFNYQKSYSDKFAFILFNKMLYLKY